MASGKISLLRTQDNTTAGARLAVVSGFAFVGGSSKRDGGN
jgi:hypothetical protein